MSRQVTGPDSGQVTTWNSWHRWTAISLLAAALLAVAAAWQRVRDGSTTALELISVTIPELLRRLRGTAIPRGRRDKATATHGPSGDATTNITPVRPTRPVPCAGWRRRYLADRRRCRRARGGCGGAGERRDGPGRAVGRPGEQEGDWREVRHRNGGQVIAQRLGQYPGQHGNLASQGDQVHQFAEALHRAGIGGLAVQVFACQVSHFQARSLRERVGCRQHGDRRLGQQRLGVQPAQEAVYFDHDVGKLTGEELGMTNAHFTSLDSYCDIESVRYVTQARELGHASDDQLLAGLAAFGRDNARTPVQWDSSPNAGFTAGTPWLAVNPNYRTVNAEAERADPASVFHYHRRLIRLRRDDPAIQHGHFTMLLPDHPSSLRSDGVILRGGQRPAEPTDVAVGRDLGGIDPQDRLPRHRHRGRGQFPRRWVCACLRDHRRPTGSRPGSR